MADHRAPRRPWTDRAATAFASNVALRPIIALGVVVASLFAVGAVAVASTPTEEPLIHCAPGESILLRPDGTWRCFDETPDPTPTVAPTLSPSPSPSGSPSASPSTSPTTSPPTSPPPSPSTSPSSSPTPSASPTTSPSSTASPTLTNCFARLAQCGYPHPGNTGVPAGVNLTPNGPTNITTPNTVVDGKILGCVAIRAANVTIRNSRIVGPCSYGVEVFSGNVIIEDSEIDCVNHKGTGVAFRNFTVRRSEVRNCENAFHTGSNSFIYDSYITGVVEVDGGHGDGIQGSSATNVTVQHNTFDLRNPITSSIIWDNLTINNLLVADNFFAAGAYTVYCPDGGTNTVYRNNRFYAPVGSWQQDTHRPAFGFKTNCGNVTTWANNYRDDNLSAVT